MKNEPGHSLLHHVGAVVFLVKNDGSIGEWNREAEALYGVSRAEALGQQYSGLLPATECERIDAHLQRIAAADPSPESAEHVVRTPGGTRHLAWRATPATDERGDGAVLFTGVDITEFRTAEQERWEAHQRALASEKLASIAALTAGVAHDIGTPMTTILGYAELLAKSAGDARNRKRATTIVEQVHRVTDLIETLRTLAPTEERSVRSVSLVAALDDALDAYREKLEENGIAIQREYQGAPQVLGDPERLQQVFQGLWRNSVAAMPSGGTLRVLLAQNRDDDAEIRVIDSGTRLRGAVRESPASARGAAQRTDATQLGLLVARTIVEEHGGKVALSGDSDGGNEFCLTFPRAPEHTGD